MIRKFLLLLLLFTCQFILLISPGPVNATTVAVTGVVPAHATDFHVSLGSSATGTIPQDTYTLYTVTYGSNLPYPSNLTLQASWTLGSVENSNTTLNIVDYVEGSAGNAYGNAAPIIDTTNRTISWNISSFPASTTKTVSFYLKTNSGYTGSSKVNFTVNTILSGANITLPTSSVNDKYLFVQASISTPTPTPTLISPTTTPTPTPTLAIQNIEVKQLLATGAGILVSTNKPSTITLSYGNSPEALAQKVIDLSSAFDHLLLLSNLLPSTRYYFKVTATDSGDKSVSSDLHTLTTASLSEAPQIEPGSLIISSDFALISSHDTDFTDSQNITIIATKKAPYEFRFKLNNYQNVITLQAILYPKNANRLSIEPSQTINLLEIQPGIFVGKLITPEILGLYEVYYKIRDTSGNIVEDKLFNIRSIIPLTVVAKKSKQPLEHARVELFHQNPRSLNYELLTSDTLRVSSPIFTDYRGEVQLILPAGKYLAKISDFSYRDQTIEFSVDSNANRFPIIELSNSSFGFIGTTSYYQDTLTDFFKLTANFFESIIQSARFFGLVSQSILLLFVALSFLSFVYKTHIPFFGVPRYIYMYISAMILPKLPDSHLFGTLFDQESQTPISKARIFFIDNPTGQVLYEVITNNLGAFYCFKPQSNNYKLLVIKSGYEPEITTPDYTQQSSLRIYLKKSEDLGSNLKFEIKTLIESLIGFLFEILIFITILLEVLFAHFYGLANTLPYLFVSIINVTCWIIYAKNSFMKSKGLDYKVN